MSPEEIRQSEWYQNLQADRQSLTELGQQIVELAGHINAAHYRFLMLIAEWDHLKGWCDGGSQFWAHCLEMRHRPRRSAREGTHGARTKEPAEDGGSDAAR